MLLTIALLLFAIHIVAWMVLPAGAATSKQGVTPVPEFGLRGQAAAGEA